MLQKQVFLFFNVSNKFNFKMVTSKLLWLILTIFVVVAISEDPKKPIVQTKGGKVQGKTSKCGLTCRYFSFLGIPYAEPPVGPLRFKNPVPNQGWEGVRDGSKHGNVCLYENIPLGLVGDEDCLFVNVFTQNVTSKSPVIVWIHGGGFWFGSGNSFIYGLDNFVAQGLVAVSINYRLGALGFFSTGDEHAQGNWGMKDQVLALKWVKENIEFFGGDPNDVTIFGESAGSASVNYLILSKMAEGLFHKAISNSGTTLVPWTFQNNPRKVADYMADYFELPKESEALLEGLRKINGSDFIAAQPNYFKIEVPRGMRPFYFVPNVEPENSPEPKFLTKSPYETIKSGEFSNVPYLVGYNSRESLFLIRELGLDKELFDKFNSNPHFLVPFAWNIKEGTNESEAVYSAFQTYYWGGGNLTDNMKQEWINVSKNEILLFTDEIFKIQIQKVFFWKHDFTRFVILGIK